MKYLLIALVALAIAAVIGVRVYRIRTAQAAPPAQPVPPAQAAPGVPQSISDISALSITLKVKNEIALFVLLGSDGTINRMGTGNLANAERGLFIGKTDPAVFQAVRSHVTDAMWRHLGEGFKHPDPQGDPCSLKLLFKFKDGGSSGLLYLYGSESEGPPKDVAEFVRTAVRETDPWYENFKRNAAKSNER